jgi:hypothetical protein
VVSGLFLFGVPLIYPAYFFNLLKTFVVEKFLTFLAVLFISFSFSSCAAIADIFKAGVWVGVLIVIGIIGLIIFLVSRGSNK